MGDRFVLAIQGGEGEDVAVYDIALPTLEVSKRGDFVVSCSPLNAFCGGNIGLSGDANNIIIGADAGYGAAGSFLELQWRYSTGIGERVGL